jgi:hypothetical protein
MRRLMTGAAGVISSAGVVLAIVATPAPAQGTMSSHYGGLRGHCVGTRIASHNIVNKRGKAIGHTELWYSKIKGGQNCVMTYNKGGSPWTRARIWRKGTPTAASGDEGNYSIYAGGSYVNNTDGRCVVWGGSIGDFYWYSDPDGVHCG